MTLPAWTREPLVHFLLGGALLFAFFAWRGEPPDPASRSIAVSRADQAQLAMRFEAMMQRPPTDAELDALVERYLREEILYREALRLGLDSDDPVVRRRLAQKMDELAGARAETAPVSEQTLREWLARHPERFAEETRYSFDQLWFENRDEAEDALQRLGRGADWRGLGGRISLPPSIEDEPGRLIGQRYGTEFQTALAGLAANGEWSQPVRSGFGWHLVRLREQQVGEVPPFASIRDEVEADWRTATIAERREQAFDLLRDAYRIEIAE